MPGLGPDATALLAEVAAALDIPPKKAELLGERLWRFCSAIRQPRKDDGTCNKTPFFERWDTNPVTSHLTTGDRRYATEQECQRIAASLLALALEAKGAKVPTSAGAKTARQVLGRPLVAGGLRCCYTNQAVTVGDLQLAMDYTTQRLGAYEIPVGYVQDLAAGGRHEIANVRWMKPIHVNYQLRKALATGLVAAGVAGEKAADLLDKIQVKSYCTDKVTMPPHFSNRDIRWATWPEGIQYASHHDCARVELELMAALFEFDGAPALDPALVSAVTSIRGATLAPGARRCAVTGKKLVYQAFVDSISSAHGKAEFHVGHLVPLTRGGKHKADNIAWMSGAGNRIQGNDTLDEIEATLAQATAYHMVRDSETGKPIPPERIGLLLDALNKIRKQKGLPPLAW